MTITNRDDGAYPEASIGKTTTAEAPAGSIIASRDTGGLQGNIA